MIEPVATVAAMAPYALADVQPGLISLAQNESAYPPSPAAIEAASAAMLHTALYSDPDWAELREAIAVNHPCRADQILCGAGSMELIGSVIRAFTTAGDEVVGSAYGYLFVATACQQAGSAYVQAPEPDFAICVDSLLAQVTASTRVVFVCNPGNPTGTRVDNAELIRLRRQLNSDVLLVIDQAYAEFDIQHHHPVFELVADSNTVVTRTFSKAYALAGQRIGWGVFPPAVAMQVRKLLNPNNVSLVAQSMAVAAMKDQAYMQSIVDRTAATRESFRARLGASGLESPQSFTNFLLLPFSGTEQATAMDAALRSAGFLLRAMGGYGLSNCLRVTIGTDDAMARVADVITAESSLPF